MTSFEIKCSPLENIPWEERSEKSSEIVWRSLKNPIITRDAVPGINSIFNSAVVPFQKGFAGVFRCDNNARDMQIHSGRSVDGFNWKIEPKRIHFISTDDEIGKFVYGYDPRVCWLEDRYYITWCNGYHGPTIGVGYTYDFDKFYQLENAFLPYNRNGVLFPRRINGKFAMFSRPSDTGHTAFGDIFYSESPDMIHWGHHRHVMAPSEGWQSTKVGAGPTPIETSEGWLMIYHGVLTSCNGFVYSFGAALLDLDQPWKVIHRTRPYLIHPREIYENVGDAPTGRMAIYYGGADTVTCLAYTRIPELIDFIKANSY
jgi:beta-1,4-mannooligosaccharide/beta-1,4-mannosyl-N-acetylglucosamine phosphorylase